MRSNALQAAGKPKTGFRERLRCNGAEGEWRLAEDREGWFMTSGR